MNAAFSLLAENIDALIFGTDLVSIAGLKGIDLYTGEDHTESVSMTSLPIESGASITDHAVVNPSKLMLKGVVSNITTLLPGIPFLTGDFGIENQNKAREGWQNIERLLRARNPVTVVTSLKVYANMVLTSLNAPVNVETGTNLYFTMTLDEAKIVGSQIVPFPPSKLGPVGPKQGKNPAANMSSKINGGQRQSSTATTQSASVAAQIFKYFGL